MAGLSEAAAAQEDVLWAGELVAPLNRDGITQQEQQRAVIQWFLRWERVVDFVQSLPMVTVAVLHGPGSASTEALQIAVACDFRLAADATVCTRFPQRQTLPGVTTFQLSKHVVPLDAQMLLVSSTCAATLRQIQFTQETTVEAIAARAQLVAPALLLKYRTLLDALWSMPRTAVFDAVEAYRRSLTPLTAETAAPATAQVDIKYKSGALFVTFRTRHITTALLKVRAQAHTTAAASCAD